MVLEKSCISGHHVLLRARIWHVVMGEIFETDTSKQFFPSDGHFTVNGNRLLADHLQEILP